MEETGSQAKSVPKKKEKGFKKHHAKQGEEANKHYINYLHGKEPPNRQDQISTLYIQHVC